MYQIGVDSPITKRIERGSTSVCHATYNAIISHNIVDIKEKLENHLQNGSFTYKSREPEL